MNKEQKTFKKVIKARKKKQARAKKVRILKQWHREQKNRGKTGLSLKGMPVHFKTKKQNVRSNN